MKLKPIESTVREYINIERTFQFYNEHKRFISLTSQIKKHGKEIDWLKLCYHTDMIDIELIEIIVNTLIKSKIDVDDLREKVQNIQIPVDKQLEDELEDLVNSNYMNQAAISYDCERNSYSFNNEMFRDNLMSMASIGRNREQLYIYNQVKGIYDILNDCLLGQITKYLMDRAVTNFWHSSYEKEIKSGLERSVNAFEDADIEMKICLKNGVYDLKEKKLLPHTPNYFFTSQVPIVYKDSATCPRFIEFIKEIMCDDEELMYNLQELMGYTLINNTNAEKAFYLYGCGSNGKSVFIKVLKAMLGEDNVSTVPLSKFGKQFGIGAIEGKMANISSENEVTSNVNSEALKGIISGDTIEIEKKFKDAKSYKPTCKLIFVLNTLPDTLDNTYGYYRKVRIVPFNRIFKEEEQDVNLEKKLLEELSGIFNWALEGAIRLIDNNYKFTESIVINSVNKKYKLEQNPVSEFYNEGLIYKEEKKTLKKDVIDAYKEWLEMNGLNAKNTDSPQKFWKLLENEAKIKDVSLSYSKKNGSRYLNDYVINPYIKQNKRNTTIEFIY